jgi:hypothetical protein
MAVKLMNLRHVPVDELMDIFELLDNHAIAYYETSAGTFGISLAALWLRDESQLEEAQKLLNEYAAQRFLTARAEFESTRKAGKPRTFVDIARENPLRYAVYIIVVIGLFYFSIAPWVQATEAML